MLRRDGRLFLHSLRTVFILGALLLLCCAGAVAAVTVSESGDSRLTIGVCNLDADSVYGSLVISFVSGNERVEQMIALEFYDSEEEASEAVQSGEAAAAIIIPEAFFSHAQQGENLPCRLILGGESESAKLLIGSYTETIGELLTTGEQIIFSGDYLMVDVGADSDTASTFNLYMNLAAFRELEAAIDPETYLALEELSYTDAGLGYAAHYAAAYLALFLGILPLGYSRLYHSDAVRGRILLLRSFGVRAGQFLLWKSLLPAALNLLLLTLFAVAAGILLPVTVSPAAVLCVLLAAALAGIWGALFGFGLGNTYGVVLFVVQALGLFLCGGIVPYARLSPVVLKAGTATPLGVLYGLLSPLLGGSFDPAGLLAAAVVTLIGVLLAERRWQILPAGGEQA